MAESASKYLPLIAKRLAQGKVVPFFGAGVSLADRKVDEIFSPGANLPSGWDLALHLEREVPLQLPDEEKNLLRVAQIAELELGDGPLYDMLNTVFGGEFTPTCVHKTFAGFARIKGRPQDVIVTTNYDDLMERAYREVGVEYDLLVYEADDPAGLCRLYRPDGETEVIEEPNRIRHLLETRPLIIKIHGSIDPAYKSSGFARSSFVITEDDYIAFPTEIERILPVPVTERLRTSHILFLGYSLSDWNLRVILHRIWKQSRLSYKSWAIDRQERPIDTKIWSKRDVDFLVSGLEEFVNGLRDHAELQVTP